LPASCQLIGISLIPIAFDINLPRKKAVFSYYFREAARKVDSINAYKTEMIFSVLAKILLKPRKFQAFFCRQSEY